MPGDYTRFTFAPGDDHIGVLMQQGRVLLDADYNELVELLERRIRAGTLDTFGRCVVPLTTPDGFLIGLAGPVLTIGRGRIYVDGILAENHGGPPAPPAPFDAVIAETVGTSPVRYDQQPYFPNPPALPQGGGPHLVYVDVWQREVTYLEEPDLLEKAVGVDSATRLQTVWQVKVLADVGAGVTCATPGDQLPKWVALTAPPAGRLTVRAVGVPAETDPCVVSPAGGYRGTENRLYRVEVHQGGAAGTATFKWSRDNASIAAAVLGLDAARKRLTVSRTARDAVLRFSPDDWVEVLDDRLELAGQPGVLRKVAVVDDVAGVVELAAALPVNVFDPNDAARHTRLRRWDQKGLVRNAANVVVANVDASGGAIPIPAAGNLVLEDGIQVELALAPATGVFRTGDFWVFAARTVDASVEELTQAPPRGIHHHYCRLAVYTPATPAAGPALEDCRVFWPPREGCCTEVVNPGENIQAAIDRLPPAGGCVCLKAGLHRIAAPLRIERSWVTVHGETAGAVVRREDGVAMVRIGSPQGETIDDVSLMDVRFEVGGQKEGMEAVVRVTAASGVVVRGCEVVPADPDPILVAATGVMAAQASELVVERCAFTNLLGGVAAMTSGAVTVADCRFLGPAETRDDATLSRGVRGVWLMDDTVGPNQVVRNEFQHYHEAVVVGREATPTVVEDNRVFRDGSLRPAPLRSVEQVAALFAGTRPVGFLDGFAIASTALGCVIARNYVRLGDPGQKAILVTGSESVVRENRIETGFDATLSTGFIPIFTNFQAGVDVPAGAASTAVPSTVGAAIEAEAALRVRFQQSKGPPLGVVLIIDENDDSDDRALTKCSVVDNCFEGPMGAILVTGAQNRLQVTGNRVRGDALLYEQVMQWMSPLPEWAQVEAAVSLGFALGWGIVAHAAMDSRVAANHVSQMLAGVFLDGCQGVAVQGNVVGYCIGGVCAHNSRALSVTGNMVQEMAAVGIGAMDVQSSTVEGNTASSFSGVGVYLLRGERNGVGGNQVENAQYGIALLRQDAAAVWGNRLTGLARTGIAANGCTGGLVVRDNGVRFCGGAGGQVANVFGGTEEPGSVKIDAAAGIAVVDSAGDIEIDGCEVRDTGARAPGDKSFGGIRYGILATRVQRVRVRACTVFAAPAPALRFDSTGLRVECDRPVDATVPAAPWGEGSTDRLCEVSDTSVEASDPSLVVCSARQGEVGFHSNRCQRRIVAPRLPGNASTSLSTPVVTLQAAGIVANANRIRTARAGLPVVTLSLGSGVPGAGARATCVGNSIDGSPGVFSDGAVAFVPGAFSSFNGLT
jgi:nitrous oxidase accessory protein NosD